MAKLLNLFLIYALFVTLSLVIGYGTGLIFATYADIVTGTLLIQSSLATLYIFIFEFTGNSK